jgi:mono/diheme cytochrome c family protein
MLRRKALLGCLFLLPLFVLAKISVGGDARNSSTISLHPSRTSPLDLEVTVDQPGSVGSARYLTREDLLALPQVSYTVSDDPNFHGPTQISGVLLEELATRVGAPESVLVVAVCTDLYHSTYTRSYIKAHHPILVLAVNGQPPAGWPKDAEGHGLDIGPYLISHAAFTPSFHVLAHADEAQIPWGVVRLEFRDEQTVLKAIAPRGSHSSDQAVLDGYHIAQQNCFRCHNSGREGGQKAGRPWLVLGAIAATSPDYFAAYVRDPKKKNPNAQMLGNPKYDDATIQALIAYFRTFSSGDEP